MAFKLRYHEDALIDLEVVLSWSRIQHPNNTERFANDLMNHLDLLAEFPYVGTPLEGEPELRRVLHSPLFIYYRIDERREAVEVLHIWHTSRRPPL